MQIIPKLIRFARKPPREQLQVIRERWVETELYWKVHPRNDRTAYLVGLFGSGRQYITELVLDHIGDRAKYLHQRIPRFHTGPTSMIYSGHATIKYISNEQALPAVTSRILGAVRLGFADLIFVYRHPLDSLLTNWVYWRIYLRTGRKVWSTWWTYRNTDDLGAELERNFSEFRAFAEGDPSFWAGVPGPRFLSFSEYVEETELFLQSATLALRFEDFMLDPLKEFSKIVELMSVDLDLRRLQLARPRTKPYFYLAVREKAPQFGKFIDGLDEETERRIRKMGYGL
ncbi:MAG TPA: hypothetical protein VEJ67_11855 [Candidatus Cybelea sp.]|nr:hypothetical protein [Candidatus Cybelea sp.]